MARTPQQNKVQSVDTVDGAHEGREHGPQSLSSFLEATSLHGARFLPTGNVIRRVIWTLALLSCFGLSIVQVNKTMKAFYGRPFNTKITTKTANETTVIPFPAVTLCNSNFFNKRRYKDFAKITNVSNEEIEQKFKVVEKILAGSNDVYNNESKQRYPELFNRTFGEVSENQNYFTLFSNRIEDMLLPSSIFSSCYINGEICGAKNFTSFSNSFYGLCYTFNSGLNGHPLINTTLAGHATGLNLLLNIERDSYLDNPIYPLVGLVVLVHDQRTYPFMEQNSFAAKPGHHTLCSIKRKKIVNLPHPYATNCSNKKLFMFRNTGYKYSKPACLTECGSKHIIKKCGCRPVEYPDPKVPLCAPNDTALCMFPGIAEFATSKEKDACKKNCQQPCESTEYETTLSNAGLKRSVFIKKLNSSPNVTVDFPFYENFMNMSESEKKEYIDDNIVSLEVLFEDLSYDEIEQTPVFETWTLISNLGGNFGLFLGMSILTALEFIDFAFRRIYFIIRKK